MRESDVEAEQVVDGRRNIGLLTSYFGRWKMVTCCGENYNFTSLYRLVWAVRLLISQRKGKKGEKGKGSAWQTSVWQVPYVTYPHFLLADHKA